MKNSLLRIASFTVTSTAITILAAIALLGSSRIIEAQQIPVGPAPTACAGPFFVLIDPCSNGQVDCANPLTSCQYTTLNIGGQPTPACACLANLLMPTPPTSS